MVDMTASDDMVGNVLVGVHYSVSVPADKVMEFVGREDDGTDGWFEEACLAAGSWVKSNLIQALDTMVVDVEVEVDGDYID